MTHRDVSKGDRNTSVEDPVATLINKANPLANGSNAKARK